ncbi:MAG: immune inhibitor A [Candidatus Lokiarchaeota archaeon]
MPENAADALKGTDVTTLPSNYILDVKYWLVMDDWEGVYDFDVFVLYNFSVSANTEIWIQADLSWLSPDPQGRTDPVVTMEQVKYLLNEFDTNIYPKDTEYFGTPDTHDGNNALLTDWGYFPQGYYNDSARNVILVSNIKDENYYTNFPYYIAGFYSPSFEGYFDRNIISIDAYDWEDRVGPDVSRPYLYESTIAHEYQHLIHDDYNPDDPSYMNEGCSMFAEMVCGYPIPWDDIDSYLATPDNSLTVWEDQTGSNILADYGAAALWATYLNDHYSSKTEEFLAYFVQNGIPGEDGINAALEHFGYKVNFDQVYTNWRIANLIHSDRPGHGIYNYKTIDLSQTDPIRIYDVSGSSVPPTRGTDFGDTETILGIDLNTSLIGPHGSDYFRFTDLNYFDIFTFDGDDTAIYGWQQVEDGWWSDAGNLMNTLLSAEVYVDPANPILTFDTKYDIEDYWDFGFVQVFNETSGEWQSLENMYTTYDHDPSAHPDVVANLPGITGTSDGWINMNFDLSAYAGENVLLGFRYVTDWYTTYAGWYINNVKVSGVTPELSATYPASDFVVTLIKETTNRHGRVSYSIDNVPIHGQYKIGIDGMFSSKWNDYYLIVSPTMEHGFTDYQFSIWNFAPRFK